MGGVVDAVFGGGPEAPDPYAVSAAESKANIEAARVTAALNRANQITPWGSLTWEQTPGTFDEAGYNAAMRQYEKDLAAWNASGKEGVPSGLMGWKGASSGLNFLNLQGAPTKPSRESFMTGSEDSWTSRVTLDPRMQALLDKQMAQSLAQQSAVDSAISRANALGNVQGLDLPDGAMPTSNEAYRKQIQDALYGQMASRLDPMWQQREGDLESKLAAQGITQGSEAYNREQQNFGLARNDAYQSALNNAITQGESAVAGQFGRDMGGRQQGTNEALAEFQSGLQGRGQVLNELSAMRTGAQVQQPQFGSTQSGAVVAPANVGANIWNGYNAQQAQNSSMMGGLTSLGTAALMAPTGTFTGLASGLAGMFSDRRLKSNIKRVGTHKLGIGLYEYDIFGERQRGVMADEVEQVLPSAVSTHESGFKMVDYSQL